MGETVPVFIGKDLIKLFRLEMQRICHWLYLDQ